MRKLIALIAFLSFASIASAQVVIQEQDINKMEEVKYVKLLGIQKAFSSKIIINIDYGQKFQMFKPQMIQGPDGKNKDFNSLIEALNFMDANGWEYVNSYPLSTGNSGTVYHYLLKRKDENTKVASN
ncbi:hypothetical protein V6R21_07805 [Limibacter armeniacum]|uniref:hypothetical protein n=1 Tax=Limibacter armeniacum TaxID=466084 RepID=UPI002FE6517F